MKLNVIFLPRARLDLLEISAYIRRDNPAAVDRWLDDVDRTLGRLGAFPQSGVVPKDRRLAALGYRMVVIGEYLAFYVVRRKKVRIRRILHGKRRYTFLLPE